MPDSRRSWLIALALPLALAAWLWPIGFGLRMPVGGDVTAFSFGLMARYDAALGALEWPWWVPEWGFGFPGVAESQMGVYYPPHLLLYGLLAPEAAYTASLVLHLLWGMAGACRLARAMGISPWSSALAAIVWGLQGFMLAHLPHHWSYTVGSWLPWAWALAWQVARGPTPNQSAWWLALVLAVQVLPGHFQLAFITQVGVLLIGGLGCLANREVGSSWISRAGRLALAGAMAAGLAAAQWVPTLRLAALAPEARTFEYLSGFAGTPLHLVNYVAPLLFHQSPLWRPIIWDPFHTSPEEWQPYIGLVPLLLALGGIVRGIRRSREVRVLTAVAVIALLLSLGPYVPGFRYYCWLPGFSFFRAPARWGLATSTALAVLAGFGLDYLREHSWKRARLALGFSAVLALAAPLAVVGFSEALLAERPTGGPATAAADLLLSRLPWGEPTRAAGLSEAASRPFLDHRVRAGYARNGWGKVSFPGLRFDSERLRTYRSELLPPTLLVALIVACCLLLRDRRRLAPALLLLSAADLVLLGRTKPVDPAPLRPLVEQSAVLGRLRQELPPGSRVVDPLQNLSMAAGLAPVIAYRTLDLPVPVNVVTALRDPNYYREPWPGATGSIRASLGHEAARVVGARARLFSNDELPASTLENQPGRWEAIDDPALAGWLNGSRWVETYGPEQARYWIWWTGLDGPIAWQLDPNIPESSDASGIFQGQFNSPRPIHWHGPTQFDVAIDDPAGSRLVLTHVHDPQWTARYETPAASLPLRLEPTLGGWSSVKLPPDGAGTARFRYEPAAERTGLAISAGSAALFLLAWLAGRSRRRSPGSTAHEPKESVE